MIKHKIWLFLFSLCIPFYFFLTPSETQAATGNGADFTVNVIPGTGQTDPELDYFSLNVLPNKTYPVTTSIENLNATKTLDFEASLVTATTSSHGNINYTPSTFKRDKSAAVVLPELSQNNVTKQKISIPPKSQKNVTFTLQIPDDGIYGTVLGSVYVHRTDQARKDKSSFGIANQFSMALPVIITQGTPPKITPKLSLTDVVQNSVAGAAQLTANIHNASPVMFGKIQLTAKVYQGTDTSADPVLTQTDKNFQMAPNSTLQYDLRPKDGKPLKSGTYAIKIHLTSGDQSFDLKRTFDITSTSAVNRRLLKANKNTTNPVILWIILGILALLILVLILVIALKSSPNRKRS